MLAELKNITKIYQIEGGFLSQKKTQLRAVDDVSLSIVKAENVSLVGESGSGKSTLARILMKLITIDCGQIYFQGEDITRLQGGKTKEFRKNIQMVFQDPFNSLDPRMSIFDILKEAMHLEKDKYKTYESQLARMKELLQSVRLDPKVLNRYPHEFSGGERQRIAIARALIPEPKLLILDEAVSALDVLIQFEFLQLLASLQKEYDLTYLFITHNLKIIKNISQRVAVMYKGKIVEVGPVVQIFKNPLHPYTQQLLSAAMHYKADADAVVAFNSSGKLIEKQPGHFVLE